MGWSGGGEGREGARTWTFSRHAYLAGTGSLSQRAASKSKTPRVSRARRQRGEGSWTASGGLTVQVSFVDGKLLRKAMIFSLFLFFFFFLFFSSSLSLFRSFSLSFFLLFFLLLFLLFFFLFFFFFSFFVFVFVFPFLFSFFFLINPFTFFFFFILPFFFLSFSFFFCFFFFLFLFSFFFLFSHPSPPLPLQGKGRVAWSVMANPEPRTPNAIQLHIPEPWSEFECF